MTVNYIYKEVKNLSGKIVAGTHGIGRKNFLQKQKQILRFQKVKSKKAGALPTGRGGKTRKALRIICGIKGYE